MTAILRSLGLTVLLTLSLFTISVAEQPPLQAGDSFPELLLAVPATAEARQYLQLAADKTFTPSQIKTELLLIELLNVHCPHCQMQTPSYNELFKLIEENPETKGKIKLLGFAIGNLESEVEAFKRGHQIKFPILADPNFAVWRAVGARATPFTIYVRQDNSGQAGVVTGTMLGLNTHYQELYQTLTRMMAANPAELRQTARKESEKQQSVRPILSELQLEYRVRSAFTRFGTIEQFTKLSLPSHRQVFTALIHQGQTRQWLFAEVTSRSSVCDICHDVHFIYLFDRSTRVIDFVPLHLTKYGNIPWSEREVQTMRTRVLGKYLSMPQPFDPKVDAISSATMTSAIIFDNLAQGDELIQELHAQGLL